MAAATPGTGAASPDFYLKFASVRFDDRSSTFGPTIHKTGFYWKFRRLTSGRWYIRMCTRTCVCMCVGTPINNVVLGWIGFYVCNSACSVIGLEVFCSYIRGNFVRCSLLKGSNMVVDGLAHCDWTRDALWGHCYNPRRLEIELYFVQKFWEIFCILLAC